MKRILLAACLAVATSTIAADQPPRHPVVTRAPSPAPAAPPVVEAKAAPRISVETLAAIKSINVSHGERYGAGVGVGYKLNDWVTGRVRAISYHDDPGGHWRGPAIDEGSLLVEATLFRTKDEAFSLSVIGGADCDFELKDAGFSAGLRATLSITDNLSLFGECRLRHWFASDNHSGTTVTEEYNDNEEYRIVTERRGGIEDTDLISTAGLQLSF